MSSRLWKTFCFCFLKTVAKQQTRTIYASSLQGCGTSNAKSMPSNYHCAERCRFYPQNTVVPTSAALSISIVCTIVRRQPLIICCSTFSFIWVINMQEWEKDIWLFSRKQSDSFEPQTITLWNTLSFQKPHLFLMLSGAGSNQHVPIMWLKQSLTMLFLCLSLFSTSVAPEYPPSPPLKAITDWELAALRFCTYHLDHE